MAVMASHLTDGALPVEKPLATDVASGKDGLAGGVEVNGHASPLATPAENNVKSASSPSPISKAVDAVAQESPNGDVSSNGVVSTSETSADQNKTSAEPDSKEAAEPRQASQPATDESTGVAPEPTRDDAPPSTAPDVDKDESATRQAEATGPEESASKDVAAPPASTSLGASDAAASEEKKPSSPPSAEDDAQADVPMTDAPPAVETSQAGEPSTSAQEADAAGGPDVEKGEEVDLHPQSMSNLALDASQGSSTAVATADVSMSDAPPSPTKVTRGRDDDEAEEPAAKRVKTSPPSDSVEVKLPSTATVPPPPSDAQLSSPARESGPPKNLADPSLDDQPITDWQARKIRGILAGIKKTKAGNNFKLGVKVLWPDLWPDYSAKIAEPTDLTTMEKRLKGTEPDYQPYPTMGEFKKDVRRLYENSLAFNGEAHDVTKAAQLVRDQIFEKMSLEPAVEVPRAERKEPVKHHPSRNVGARVAAQPRSSPPAAAQPSDRRQSKGAAAAAAVADKPVESPAFAIPPNNNGVPLIRRDSTKNADDRPKRPIHPPKNKDLGYEPKKKKKLPPELRFCDEVLTELRKGRYYEFNQFFLTPVDPIALNIPTYHKTVKRPMDLQTMGEKLHTGQYGSAKDFEKDFYQIIKNCRLFNGDDHIVTHKALELEDLFKREWAKKDDWMAKNAPAASAASQNPLGSPRGKDDSDEEDLESEGEAEEEKEQSSATLEALQRRLNEENDKLNAYMKSKNPDIGMVEVSQTLVVTLQKQIIQERQRLAAQAGSSKKSKAAKPAKGKKSGGASRKGTATAGAAAGGGAASAGSAKKASGGAKKSKRVLGTVEKEVVATAISNLEGDLLNKAIDIIKKDTNENENDSGELELDIDLLSQDALAKLYDISIKAFPDLRAEKEKHLGIQAAPEAAAAKQKPSKPKKNKPMGKAEQERRLQQLQDLKAAMIKNRGSGSQEPVESIEGNASNGSVVHAANESEEEDSEED
ncbi:hypothetical protein VTK73DRAFT_8744 [Phialemonium thermophilum]|uniref:Transcription regulator bdf1 n=1 Tax=Phialemonium thermophilum TaxID=223376 RepID=A0ABR3W6S6_9PEZI